MVDKFVLPLETPEEREIKIKINCIIKFITGIPLNTARNTGIPESILILIHLEIIEDKEIKKNKQIAKSSCYRYTA